MPRYAFNPAIRNQARQALAFWRFLGRRFNDDQCFEAAGALSFTTVFALVPLLTVTISVLASFQEFGRYTDALTDWVFKHFVPTVGEQIETLMLEFIGKASQLTAVGIIALFISGLLLVTSIEHSFNRIWRVVAPRRALARFVVFWAALTLGPLLVGAGLAVSSALLASPYLAAFSERFGLESLALSTLPFLVTFAAATLSYLIVPNCPVRLRHALLGGLFSAAAFEVAKWGFPQMIGRFASYQQIYGAAFALIPVTLLWIYVSWVVALLGASLTAALGAFVHEANKRDLPERERFPALLRLLTRLREAQMKGVGLSVGEIAGQLPDVPEATIADLLGLLERERIAQRTDLGSWILSRDPDIVRIRALYRGQAFLLPLSDGKRIDLPANSVDGRIAQLCENAAQAAERQLDHALADLYRKGSAKPAADTPPPT